MLNFKDYKKIKIFEKFARQRFFSLFNDILSQKETMQKTKKSIAKRFKITASGKVIRRGAGKRHLLSAKSVKQKRNMGRAKVVTPGVAANVKKAMPFA